MDNCVEGNYVESDSLNWCLEGNGVGGGESDLFGKNYNLNRHLVNIIPRLALGEESIDDSRLMTICSRPCPLLLSSDRVLNYAVSALQRLRHVMSAGHFLHIFAKVSKIEGLFSSTVAPRRRVFVGSVDSRD